MCLVSALLAYLAVRPLRGQHLFVWEDGKPLSRSELGHLLKKALEADGLDHLIKVLGCWRSEVFQLCLYPTRHFVECC